MIKLGGNELKKDSSRVYLVDLTKDKIVFQPAKVDLPSEVPDTQKDDRAWQSSILKAIEELKKSGEVQRFFEGPAK